MGIVGKNLVLHFLLAANIVRIPYPEVNRNSAIFEDYHGTTIHDPYRWLEDNHSEKTQEFVEEQQNLTQSFLNAIPSRDHIHDRLTNIWNYPKTSAPRKVGTKYYTLENSGLQNQSVLYVQDSLNDTPKVFLDPNKFSTDGTTSLSSYAFSKDGNFLAYATQQSGSDWKLIKFINILKNETLSDVLLDSKWPSLEWSHDSNGVFYARYPSPNTFVVSENARIYYHKIGTPQVDDIIIAEFPEFPQRSVYAEVSHCGNYLIVGGRDVYSANAIYIASLSGGIDADFKDKLVPIFPSATDALYAYVTNQGSTFLFLTSKDAPNHRIITLHVDVDSLPEPRTNQTNEKVDKTEIGQYSLLSSFLEENPKKVISWTSVIHKDKLLICYLEDVKNTLEMRSLQNGSLIHKIPLPPGTISLVKSDGPKDKEFFFLLQNFLSPGTVYRCEVDKNVTCEIFKQISVANTDLNTFITDQVFYPSKDGTLIPMYLLRKKNVSLDGNTPVLLYGYGGFNVNNLPRFSVSNLLFVENFNGIFALANIRGGGEYGEKWHEDGSLLKKQNSFDDFHAAADYLIKNNYTNPSKLAITGRSNGGLLVAACINQRPELYRAAIAEVGVLDMLRFQKFTIGYKWCAEYGCSEDKDHFKNLIKYSPLHNIRFPAAENVQYPSVLVTTADHDDRVVPAHSYKYIAELQHTIGQNPRQTNPLLLRVDVKAGHGAGKPTSKQIEEISDKFAFLAETMDLEFISSTDAEKPSASGKN